MEVSCIRPWRLQKRSPGVSAQAMYRHVLVILTALILSACGQSEPPAKGDAGPPGPPGPAGPPGPPGAASGAQAPAIKVIARPCDQLSCGASCEENEQIINAYATQSRGRDRLRR
jgi:hypothetical protein